ncbi:MAG: hypothetical protein SH807_05055 [Blastochloris sp.]|nr:hypothetical protein [Blastochloris sp.]
MVGTSSCLAGFGSGEIDGTGVSVTTFLGIIGLDIGATVSGTGVTAVVAVVVAACAPTFLRTRVGLPVIKLNSKFARLRFLGVTESSLVSPDI